MKSILKNVLLLLIIYIIIVFVNITTVNNLILDYLGVSFSDLLLYIFAIVYSNKFILAIASKFIIEKKNTLKSTVIRFFCSFVVTLAVIFLVHIFKEMILKEMSFEQFLANGNQMNYIFVIIITFIVVLLFHAFYFYKAYTENRVKEQKIIAGTAHAKFESLKNQIDPHFLFNSLNVLSSLIEENPENAQRFTTSLSKVYRYVLEQKDKDLVPIEEELAFAKTYMNLLKMRFENSLFYELPKDINPEAKVVPLSLQLLLENTVKHNVVTEKKPLHIRIFIEQDYLVIQNDYQKKVVLQDRQGVGLQNIINRYGIITNRKVFIMQTEQTFTVKIPILTKQITLMEATEMYNENTAYFKAKKQVEKIKDFYGSLIGYCCVIPFLIFINLKYSSGFYWFWFPMFGWGFGLVMKGYKVYGHSSNWEERKIQEILRKEEQKKTWK